MKPQPRSLSFRTAAVLATEQGARFTARRSVLASSLLLGLLAWVAAPSAKAIGHIADITIIDRETSQALPVVWHEGEAWVAGRPGARYAISVKNRSGGRIMAVMSVDGVNIVTGETASWSQSGYVFDTGLSSEITGWRKSSARVAAFNFTSLPDSYAARTGRPDQVGVIGVALFREKPSVTLPIPAPYPRNESSDSYGRARPSAVPPSPAQGAPGAAASEAPARSTAEGRVPATPAEKSAESSANSGQLSGSLMRKDSARLGTGHGASEASYVSYTRFERATSQPAETIVIRYDSRQNLISRGILPAESAPVAQPRPEPFPRSAARFVPDPPRW